MPISHCPDSHNPSPFFSLPPSNIAPTASVLLLFGPTAFSQSDTCSSESPPKRSLLFWLFCPASPPLDCLLSSLFLQAIAAVHSFSALCIIPEFHNIYRQHCFY
ncbi:hypothetical protein GQ54DRAFT_50835 [Martensiomyces pterosporus]|nr:hypothetical protein GQ54DRAFT_50835 [Martensiomyces pterosporus]